MSVNELPRLARRTVIKMIAAVAAAPLWTQAGGMNATAPTALKTRPAGTLSDPNLIDPVVPWELTLSEDERMTIAALCDMIIPADDRSPAASTIGAQDFIDEWVSAPYMDMQADGMLVREGLVWLDQEAQQRFTARFRDLDEAQKISICDDICFQAGAAPEFQSGARFFDKVRGLTAAAFYTTREGMADIGYVGNVPLAAWLPPPVAALKHVGLDEQIK